MPRPSVTDSNWLPEPSLMATTVTPGSTPPVESVMVPVTVASCAKASTGSASMAPRKINRLTTLEYMGPPPKWRTYHVHTEWETDAGKSAKERRTLKSQSVCRHSRGGVRACQTASAYKEEPGRKDPASPNHEPPTTNH